MSVVLDIPGIWYYYWLIPSLISLLMSILMILHISFSWKKDNNMLHFQKVCLIFGFFDIIQNIGMILVISKGHCRVQYILFLSGSLYKAFTAVGGITGIYIIIIKHYFPTEKQIIQFSIILFIISSIVLSILFITDVNHDLNCTNNARENLIAVDNVTLKSQLVFGFTFCLFTVICCILVTYMTSRILYRFKSYTHFYTFRTVIFLYVLIFLFAILPGCIYLINLVILHEYHNLILELTGVSLCSSGWLYSVSYFILVFSPKIKKLFKISHYYDRNSQIMLSSGSTTTSSTIRPGRQIDSLTKKILYYDESNQWIESTATDQYNDGYNDNDPSISGDRPNSQQNMTPIQQKDDFHSNLISSLYNIRIETPQNE